MIKKPIFILNDSIVDDDLFKIAEVIDKDRSERLVELFNDEVFNNSNELTQEIADAKIIKGLKKTIQNQKKEIAKLKIEKKDLLIQINNYLDEED